MLSVTSLEMCNSQLPGVCRYRGIKGKEAAEETQGAEPTMAVSTAEHAKGIASRKAQVALCHK
jgi:hypothetical protein